MKKFRAALLILVCLASPALALDRPKLRILNASPTPVEVFWLAPDGQCLPNGRIAPGKDRIIGTTPRSLRPRPSESSSKRGGPVPLA